MSLELFRDETYLKINKARFDHLASLKLPWKGKTVLEVGAGIGDQTEFLLKQGAIVTATDGRPENVAIIKNRFNIVPTQVLDLEAPMSTWGDCLRQFDVVHCYGVLYHLKNPFDALAKLTHAAKEWIIVETCVSADTGISNHTEPEANTDPRSCLHGWSCRPSRASVMNALRELMGNAYITLTQPDYREFVLNWD